jgi:hypothetical protein
MKSTLLFTAVATTIVMLASNARADWSLFNNDDSSSSSSSGSKRKGPPFLPTASIAAGIDPGKDAEIYGNFLLGVSHYPMGTEWSPFYSVALEMDLRSLRDQVGNTSTVPIFGPQLRGGISFFPDGNGILSLFNAYGLIGWRAPSAFEGNAFRFGVGISSPGVGLMILTARLALPWMVEGTCDVTEFGLRPSVRFGFSY